MAPDTGELIDEIESERARSKRVLEDADEQIEQSNEFVEKLLRLLASGTEREEALKVLRRAGLLKI